jgi:hypothetical protein
MVIGCKLVLEAPRGLPFFRCLVQRALQKLKPSPVLVPHQRLQITIAVKRTLIYLIYLHY